MNTSTRKRHLEYKNSHYYYKHSPRLYSDLLALWKNLLEIARSHRRGFYVMSSVLGVNTPSTAHSSDPTSDKFWLLPATLENSVRVAWYKLEDIHFMTHSLFTSNHYDSPPRINKLGVNSSIGHLTVSNTHPRLVIVH